MCTGTPNMDMPEPAKPVIPVTPKEKPKTLKNRRAAGETDDGQLRRQGISGLLIPRSVGAGTGQ